MMRPHEAQEAYLRAAGEIKTPEILSVEPGQNCLTITWQRRPGKIDGFLILLGASSDKLTEHKRLQGSETFDFRFTETLPGLVNGQTYFVGIVAYKGDARSKLETIWRATPNVAGRLVPAQEIRGIDVAATGEPSEVPTAPEPPAAASEPRPAPAPVTRPSSNVVCAACLSDVVFYETEQLFICRNCHTKYVQRVADGKYLPLDILTNGICDCCSPRRPLIKPPGSVYKKCSLSGEEYADLGDRVVKISELDYGLCSCCTPPQPLKLNQSGQVVCSRQIDMLYVREGHRYIMRVPEAPPSLVSEIDQALGNGSAAMLPNGVLVPGAQPRRRRRR